MIKVLAILLSVIFFFPVISLAESTAVTHGHAPTDHGYTAAREEADILEQQYGITILIGHECTSASTDGFEIGNRPSGRTSFIDMLGGYNYESELRLISDELSAYPDGFFGRFACTDAPKGLRLLLADRILYEGKTMAGVTTLADGYCNIFLGVGAFGGRNVHHEIWHAMEYRITAEYPEAFDRWYEMNPEDFLYSDDITSLDIWEQAASGDAFFVRGYSTIDEYEDRATIFEALFLYDQDWWDEHPYIRRKLDIMMEAAEPVLGKIHNEH